MLTINDLSRIQNWFLYFYRFLVYIIFKIGYKVCHFITAFYFFWILILLWSVFIMLLILYNIFFGRTDFNLIVRLPVSVKGLFLSNFRALIIANCPFLFPFTFYTILIFNNFKRLLYILTIWLGLRIITLLLLMEINDFINVFIIEAWGVQTFLVYTSSYLKTFPDLRQHHRFVLFYV